MPDIAHTVKLTSASRFITRLATARAHPILTDGSMAAALHAEGLSDPLIERYNLTQPIAVEHVHRSFAEAGAELLMTMELFATIKATAPTETPSKPPP